jgi:hypothetical protein
MLFHTILQYSAGLIIAITEYTVVQGRGRRRTTRIETSVDYGSGFVIDGDMQENGCLKLSENSTRPIVVSVAHIIPTSGTTKYYFKRVLYEKVDLFELNLITYNRGLDVCIFDFVDNVTTPNDVICLTVNFEYPIYSGKPCYLIGHPIGDAQISVASGVVRDPTYCFSNLASGMDQLYHSAPATNGNSGSCILDQSGILIGIHAWAWDTQKGVLENFSGGLSASCLVHCLNLMMATEDASSNKYFSRKGLGITARILDDVFRIANLNNNNIKNIDGIIVEKILTNIGTKLYSVDTHNKKQGTIKIEVGDIITHISYPPFQNDEGTIEYEYASIGYTREPPLMSLMNYNYSSHQSKPVTIKLRKAPNYNSEILVVIDTLYRLDISDDTFYSRII